jgi:hypothetical protein
VRDVYLTGHLDDTALLLDQAIAAHATDSVHEVGARVPRCSQLATLDPDSIVFRYP